jgi:hypothetical protein
MYPIRVLDPPSEAVLLVVRACLELRPLDLMTLRNWRTAAQRFTLDRQLIASRTDRATLRDCAATLLSEDLAQTVVDAIYDRSAWESRRQLRRRLQKHFAAYGSYGGLEMRVRSALRALLWLAGHLNRDFLHAPRPWNRRPSGGGCTVAIIGLDGSGKSTVVAAVRAWLSSKIDVVPMYFGTGDGRPTLLLWPFKLLLPVVRRVLRSRPKRLSRGGISGKAPGLLYSVLLMIWAIVVALEKRTKLRAAWRGAKRGLVIITDRYPQNECVGFNDGPLLSQLRAAPLWLCRFEAAAYELAHRLPPDLVIKLEVLPETIARREPEIPAQIIEQRIAVLPHLRFPGARIVCVNAEQPLQTVIGTVKQEIWKLL